MQQQLEKKIDALTQTVGAGFKHINVQFSKIDKRFDILEENQQFLTEMTKDGFTAMTSDFASLEANISAELEKYMGTNREEFESYATRIKDLETEVWPDGKPEPAH